MSTSGKSPAAKLLDEISFIDNETLELKKEYQHNGCPFCEIDDGDIIDTHQTRQALFYKFKRCRRCSLIYSYPRPKREIVEGIFKSEDFSEASRQALQNADEKRARDQKLPLLKRICKILTGRILLRYSYQEFLKYAKKGYRVLDVGAGHGALARELMRKGCVVEAVELNPYRAGFLREKIGIKVYESTFEDAKLEESGYDMIIFSQVLMHIFSLKSTIEKARRLLKPDGLIAASLTNFNSVIQQTIRSPYPGRGLTPLCICSWFTPENAGKIMEMSGFKVIDVIFRPTGLLDFLFVEGYPAGLFGRIIFKLMDQVIVLMLMLTKTTDYFAVVARNKK